MSDATSPLKAWVLVAGAARAALLSDAVQLSAQEVGRALATDGFGLITGGWRGVDRLTTEAFIDRCRSLHIEPGTRLVQFIRSTFKVQFAVGQIVRVQDGAEEWLGPHSYAHAVVLIGGSGGTYLTFLGALHHGLPRFPIAGTGGDAATAYKQMDDLWHLISNPGVSQEQFRALGRPIDSQDDAGTVARKLVSMITSSVHQANERRSSSGQAPLRLFICYSPADRKWLTQLRTALRPLERDGGLTSFAAEDVRAGDDRESEVTRAVLACDVAIVLVSSNLTGSDHIVDQELSPLITRATSGNVRLLWVLVSPCFWQSTKLGNFKPVGDADKSLAQMTPAAVQVTLLDIVRELARIASERKILD